MSKKYNGGIASYAIWLAEFTQFIELYQSGKGIDEIKKLSDKQNIFRMSSKARAKRCSRNLSVRIQALPQSIIELYPQLDVSNRKLVALISMMLTSRILDEFVYDVYRKKVKFRDSSFNNYEIEEFINKKRIESPEVAQWSLSTLKRLKGALKTFLRDAGLLKKGEVAQQDIAIFPLIDAQLIELMKKEQLNYELAAIGGM